MSNEPVWEHLYTQGMKSQKFFENAHLNSQNKFDAECTFQPTIRKTKRYYPPSSSNFLERNTACQEQKIEKIVR